MSTRASDRSTPLQRIWSQHADLHRRVRALEDWLSSVAPAARLSEALRILEEIEVLLPTHFALEEQDGYFSDVLAAAPELRPRADVLRGHHAMLIPQLERVLDGFRSQAAPPEREAEALVQRVSAFVVALEEHERGENALVRDALHHRRPATGAATRVGPTRSL